MGAIAIEERDSDEGYDRQRQSKVDALQDAYIEGVRSGKLGHGAGMSPYPLGSPEYAEWNRARLNTIGQAIGATYEYVLKAGIRVAERP